MEKLADSETRNSPPAAQNDGIKINAIGTDGISCPSFVLRILIATETRPRRSSRLQDRKQHQQSLGVSWRLLYFILSLQG
jgi:hypothetical protein